MKAIKDQFKNNRDRPFSAMVLMVIVLFMSSIVLAGKDSASRKRAARFIRDNDTPGLAHPDHIIFLWLENRDFDGIIHNGEAPYINSLIKEGTLFTNFYAITHPSYPNYIDFFAGDPNGVTDDGCIDIPKFATPNLYTKLKEAGKSFAWYSEDLPATGSKVCIYANYVAKHNPVPIFTNVPDSVNKRFEEFPTDYSRLENVVCISPNKVNDMHSGSVQRADSWIKTHLAPLVLWCNTHNSIFVIEFDEGENNGNNRIPVIAVGESVKRAYKLKKMYDHFSWTKTVSAMFSAPDAWTDNLNSAAIISGCWQKKVE